MRKYVVLSLLLLTLGCTTPADYSDPIDPDIVTLEELKNRADFLEDHYQRVNQVNGIVFQAYRSDPDLAEPDFYGNGGDSCIFTGHKLAADVFRYGVTKKAADFDKILQSLRGLYIVTHATGTPGVICRTAFPADRAEEWNFPDSWGHRIEGGFVHTGPEFEDPFNPGSTIGPMVYYTRATKDQLTGLLFGLTVAWKHLAEDGDATPTQIAFVKQTVANITEKVYTHLRQHDFMIRDENGNNDTSADDVDGLMKLQLLALYRKTVAITSSHRSNRIQEKYEDEFCWAFGSPADWFHLFNNYQQYFAWNLRYLRSYSVFQLEEDSERQETIKSWMQNRLWPYTYNHLNTKFIFMFNAVTEKGAHLDDALFALKSLSLKQIRSFDSPLASEIEDRYKPSLLQVMLYDWGRFVLPPHLRKPTSFSTWQKEPWDVGSAGHNGREDTSGIDYILAYWLGRYHGFVSLN